MNIDSALLEKITDQTDLILWLDDSPLNESTKYFSTIDYILDGLLTQYTRTMDVVKEAEFIHQQFGKKIHILFKIVSMQTLNLEHIKPEEKKHGLVIGSFSSGQSLVKSFADQVTWVDEF